VSRERFGWFDHKITSVEWLFNIFFNRDRFAKTNIPTLEQTVTQLLASGQRMFIDIKDHNKKVITNATKFIRVDKKNKLTYFLSLKIFCLLFL
jgi:hypothetical protein